MRQAEVFIEPYVSDIETIVQFSGTYNLDKNFVLNVPDGYVAHIYIDEKPLIRKDKGTDINLLKLLGKDYKDKAFKVAFFRTNELPELKWGFGQINVKNTKVGEAYTVGANGSYKLKIKDLGRLTATVGTQENITLDMIKERTKGIFKKVGVPVLSDLCSNTTVSALNITSLIGEFKSTFEKELNTQEDGVAALKKYGMELKEFSVSVIFIPDEDRENLKITNKDNDDSPSLEEEFNKLKKDVLDSTQANLKSELAKLKKEIAAISEKQDEDDVLEEIDKLKNELHDALEKNNNNLDNDLIMKELESIKKQVNEYKIKVTNNASSIMGLQKNLDEVQENIKEDISTKSSGEADTESILQVIEDLKKQIDENSVKSRNIESSIIGLQKDLSDFQEDIKEDVSEIRERILENEKENEKQNSLPLYDNAKEEALAQIKITTDLLIDKAETDDDYAAPAGLIYTNVEKNLIEKFKVKHIDEVFYATIREFNDMSKTIGSNRFDKNKNRSIRDGGETYVPIPVIFRFLKAGLNKKDAITADNYFVAVNKMRHQSPENTRVLNRKLREMNLDKKAYLIKILTFFRDKGLYTKD